MRLTLAALMVATVLTAGCARKPEHASPTADPWADADQQVPVITQTAPKSVAEQLAGQTGVISMLMTDQGFAPRELKAAVNGVVKIHVKNASHQAHNLVLERWGIAGRTLAPGEENYIEFTAGEKGAWSFYSDAPGDVEPAFRGILKVE